MLKARLRHLASGGLLLAALTVGSLSLTATAASACGASPKCGNGPPPVAALAGGCTNPDCVSGTPPVVAPAPGSGVARTGTVTTINCPPPSSVVMAAKTGGGSDC
jgi:hypothetical protein